MKRAEKVLKITAILNEFYPKVEPALTFKDPYTLLIAVLLSAQCTDKRVNKVTPHLFSKAATPEQMVLLTQPEIATVIKSCGLSNNKSKAILALSKKLIDHHQGNVPDTFSALEALPGVGHKTASVVMVQAFNHPAFPVDTHIFRLARRWGLSRGNNVIIVEKDLKKLFHRDKWGRIHLQMIYFGREHCPARSHDLTQCVICSWSATKKQIIEETKNRRKKSVVR